MKLTAKLNDASLSVYDQLPIGVFTAKVTNVIVGETKAEPPRKRATIEFVLTHEGYEGKVNALYVVLEGENLFSLKGTLWALGYDREELDDPSGVEFDTDDWIGEEVAVVVEPGSFNGRPTTNARKFLPVDRATGADPNAPSVAEVSGRADIPSVEVEDLFK